MISQPLTATSERLRSRHRVSSPSQAAGRCFWLCPDVPAAAPQHQGRRRHPLISPGEAITRRTNLMVLPAVRCSPGRAQHNRNAPTPITASGNIQHCDTPRRGWSRRHRRASSHSTVRAPGITEGQLVSIAAKPGTEPCQRTVATTGDGLVVAHAPTVAPPHPETGASAADRGPVSGCGRRRRQGHRLQRPAGGDAHR